MLPDSGEEVLSTSSRLPKGLIFKVILVVRNLTAKPWQQFADTIHLLSNSKQQIATRAPTLFVVNLSIWSHIFLITSSLHISH